MFVYKYSRNPAISIFSAALSFPTFTSDLLFSRGFLRSILLKDSTVFGSIVAEFIVTGFTIAINFAIVARFTTIATVARATFFKKAPFLYSHMLKF